MTWQEVARDRGIPVWEGIVIVKLDDGMRLGRAQEVGDTYVNYTWPLGVVGHADQASLQSLIPDLTDPDTQAAYLRRLAMALGCPKDVAGMGVVFVHIGGLTWTFLAGDWISSRPDRRWRRNLILSQDRIVALAFAWPANKRIAKDREGIGG